MYLNINNALFFEKRKQKIISKKSNQNEDSGSIATSSEII